jgi:hypothetical protein
LVVVRTDGAADALIAEGLAEIDVPTATMC